MVLQSIHRGISCEHISDDDLVSDVCDAHQDARALSAAADHLRRMLQPGFSTAEYSHIEALNEVCLRNTQPKLLMLQEEKV